MLEPAKKSYTESTGFSRFIRRCGLPLCALICVLIAGFVAIPAVLGATAPAEVRQILPDATPAPAAPTELPPAPAEYTASTQTSLEPPIQQQEAPTLAFGAEDPAVAQIQERLMELGYMDSDEPTEYFGPATQEAVKRFQRVHYMTQTGDADALTQSMLFSPSARVYLIDKGDVGEDVAMLQARLMELGYYNDKTNGYFGTATSRALTAFRLKNGLSSEGAADRDTMDILYSPNAKPKIDPTPTPRPRPSATPRPASTPRPSIPPGGGSGELVDSGSANVDGLIAVAKAQLNDPYVWSQEGPDCFDCSGLVYYSLRCIGVSVGRYSAAGFSEVSSWQTVGSVSELRPGDLLFFRSDSSSRISHTGIWLGGDKYIHASSTAGKVVISSWSSWAQRNFMLGKRVF